MGEQGLVSASLCTIAFPVFGTKLRVTEPSGKTSNLRKERGHKVKKGENEIKPTHSHQKRDSLPIGKS